MFDFDPWASTGERHRASVLGDQECPARGTEMSDIDEDRSALPPQAGTSQWDALGLFIAALAVAIAAGLVGYFLMTSGDSAVPWSSFAAHWWGLAVIGAGAALANALALVGIIAKGVEIGLRTPAAQDRPQLLMPE